MNLQDIARQYRQFRRCDLAHWNHPLTCVLEALVKEYVEFDYFCSFDELVPRERLALYTLFDLAHHSDESCELHVLEVDGKPVGVAHKFADKSEWHSHVIDAEAFKVLVREMAVAALDRKLAKVTADAFDSLSGLQRGYLHFLDEAETLFAVNSPKACYGFNTLPKLHRAFYVDPEGGVHPVAAIGQFVNGRFSHDSVRGTHDVMVTLGDGRTLVADGAELMFELLSGQANVEAALQQNYVQPTQWCVGDVFPPLLRVVVYQREVMRRSVSSLWVTFATQAEFDRFMGSHTGTPDAAGTIATPLFDGQFDLAQLGYQGSVVSLG